MGCDIYLARQCDTAVQNGSNNVPMCGYFSCANNVGMMAATDEILREAIVSHVSMMVTRLQEGRNPDVIIQSPTLDALFDVYDEIDTEIEPTELGVKVIQTSSNPNVVGLLQQHAAEVSDMANRGMEAVHERMAGQSP